MPCYSFVLFRNLIENSKTSRVFSAINIGGKKRDIHEADKQHLLDAEQTYLYLCDKYPDFQLVECIKDGNIMSREKIHEMIWKIVEEKLA